MALIKCPECGKEVSDKATKCPNCGMPFDEITLPQNEHINDNQEDEESIALSSQPQIEEKRMSAWKALLIIVGSLILIGGIVWLFAGKSTKNDAIQFDTTAEDTIIENTDMPEDDVISEINGVSIVEYIKYTTKQGNTYYYRDEDGLYDKTGNEICSCLDYSIKDIAEEGSNIALVKLFRRAPVGTSDYNCGGYCITIIDQLSNSEKNSLCGFDDVKISKGDKMFFNTLIAQTPTKLTFSDIIECQGYYEDALEHLYKQYHSSSTITSTDMDDYSWMNGEWSLSSSINDPYVGRIIFRITLNINANDHTLVFVDETTGDGYRGTYTINEDQNIISCKGNYIHFDPQKHLFYEEFKGKRDYYHRTNSFFD